MGDDGKVGIPALASFGQRLAEAAGKLSATVAASFEPPVRLNESWPVLEVDEPAAGRPKGSTEVTTFLLAALKRRMAAAPDAKPTVIAVEIFTALGFAEEQAKNKADALVRAARKDDPQR